MEYPSIFEQRLDEIKANMKEFCKETFKLHDKTISLICNWDYTVSVSVINKCSEIDLVSDDLEKQCIRFIAREHPLATDLIYVESAIRVISHIKRIAHLCKKIAEGCGNIVDFDCSMGVLIDLDNMASNVNDLIFNGFASFYTQDTEVARKLDSDDDEIDDLFDSILNQTTELLKTKTDSASSIISVLFIARYLERIADRVVSIGDRVIFINTHKKPKIEKLKG